MTRVDDMSVVERKTVAGTSLLVRAGRDESTIVFLHGIGSRSFSFTRLMRAWPGNSRLVAWDAPGYGTSDPLNLTWPVAQDYAERLDFVRRQLGVARIDIVGHSLGCLIAGAYARFAPSATGRVAFLSPALGYKVVRGDKLPHAHQARIDDLRRSGPDLFGKERAPRLVFEAARRPDVVADVVAAMSTVALPGYAQAVCMLASGDLLADASYILSDAMVMTGGSDVITPPDNARQLAAVLRARSTAASSTSETEIIEGAGHAIYLEAEARVRASLTSYFAEAK